MASSTPTPSRTTFSSFRSKFASIFATPLKSSAGKKRPAEDETPSAPPPAPTPASTSTTGRSESRKRPRSIRTPRPPPFRPSPLIKRIPSMLRANEEYVLGPAETSTNGLEPTPRSKRLRRTSDNISNLIHMETAMFSRESSAQSQRQPPRATSVVPEEDPHISASAPPTDLEDDPQELDDLVNKYGFSLQEALLFLRIRNRGHEPLMPAHWQVDFGTMPDSLFFDAEVANEVGHIDSITLDGTFNATNAFRGLVGLGCVVRGKMEAKKDPEDRILAEIRKYVRWSVEDVKKHLPGNNDIYPRVVLVGSYGKGSVHCENKMHRKLLDLRRIVLRESAHLRDAPLSPNAPASTPLTTSSTIYGIAVAGPIVALVTMDCASEADPQPSFSGQIQPPRTPGNGPSMRRGTKIKTMVTLDFSDTMMDFWNAVAVALLVIAAREDELERTEFYKGHDIKPFDIHNIEDGDWDEVRRGWEKTPLKSGRRESVGPLGWSPLGAVDDDEDDPDA